MLLDPTKSRLLDGAVGTLLNAYGNDESSRLLSYSYSLHLAWRDLLGRIQYEDGSLHLDMGCGHGLLALELAGQQRINVQGVDISPVYIDDARKMEEILRGARFFVPGSSAEFSVGDINQIDFPDHTFDSISVREVVQYVKDPSVPALELFRVLKPGGTLLIEDVDDDLYLTWPPKATSLERFMSAIDALQSTYGDRKAGRKLANILDENGFEIEWVHLLGEAHFMSVEASMQERTIMLMQIEGVRDRIISGGHMSEEEFAATFSALRDEPISRSFRTNARVAVMARRPPETT